MGQEEGSSGWEGWFTGDENDAEFEVQLVETVEGKQQKLKQEAHDGPARQRLQIFEEHSQSLLVSHPPHLTLRVATLKQKKG
eukprot:925209-Pelagomonas_calceolata.AAC.1